MEVIMDDGEGCCTVWCGAVDYVFHFGTSGIVLALVYYNDENPVDPIHEERYECLI